eukprot:2731013-Rhodomonas_salina.1
MSSHNTLSDTYHLKLDDLRGCVPYRLAILSPPVLWKDTERAHDVAEAADLVSWVAGPQKLDQRLVLVAFRG